VAAGQRLGGAARLLGDGRRPVRPLYHALGRQRRQPPHPLPAGAGKDAEADEITFTAIGIAGLAYAVIAFILMQLFAAPRMRRRAEARLSAGDFGPGIGARGVASSAELQAILGQVSEALQRGQADIDVRNITIDGGDGDGGDATGRLARLKQLHDSGLISGDDYQAKKAEILSGL
jgi:hypothetical protein